MADDSSELDEIVQVPGWRSKPASGASAAAAATPTTDTTKTAAAAAAAAPAAGIADNNQSASAHPTSGLNKVSNQTFDDSTANGFTTAPATSDDDFDSDDDDDSRSNYSNRSTSNSNSMISNPTGRHSKHGGSSRQAIKGELKRSHHNVLERKRRDLLKDSFAMLRESVPRDQPKERISRAEILKQAADFIQSTVKRNASVREELDELIRRNREFEEKRKQQQQQQQQQAAAGGGVAPAGPASSAEAGQLLGVASGPGDQLTIKQEL